MKKTKTKAPAKGAGTPGKGRKKCTQVAKRPAAKTAKTRQKKRAVKPAGNNIFEGATEISMTENKIAVTRSTSRSTNGKYSERTTREYHEKTPANMRALGDIMNDRDVKKITVKLK